MQGVGLDTVFKFLRSRIVGQATNNNLRYFKRATLLNKSTSGRLLDRVPERNIKLLAITAWGNTSLMRGALVVLKIFLLINDNLIRTRI
jgi:hypothetical protein